MDLKVIQDLLEKSANDGISGQFMTSSAAELEVQELRARFFMLENRLASPIAAPVFEFDISDLPLSEIVATFKSLPIEAATSVHLHWLSQNLGLIMPYGDFVRKFDDLWFPSSDDIWLTAVSTTWLLEIDHEEMVRFWCS